MKKYTVVLFLQLVFICSIKCQSYIEQINTQHQYTMTYYQKIQEYGSKVTAIGQTIKQLKEQYNLIKAELDGLEAMRTKVLKEMKLGYYCDQCWRSKSQIEEDGTPFLVHLANVHGKMVPAPPDKYLEKNQEFNDKARELKDKLARTIAELNEAKLNEVDYIDALRRYAALWEGSVNNEDNLKVMEWARHVRELDKQRSANQDSIFKYRNLYNIEDSRPKKDQYLLSEYQRLVKVYNVELDYSKKELEDAKNQAALEKNQWIELVLNQRAAIYDIFHQANVMTPGIMFSTIAGAADYQNQYQRYTNNPQFYQADPSSNTGGSQDARSFLDNLGKPGKK